MPTRFFYCFEEDQDLKDNILRCRGANRFESLEPKYAYILHKAIVAKTHYGSDYAAHGFALRKKSNADVLKNYPEAEFGTLSYLFGGSDTATKRLIENLVAWRVIEEKSHFIPGVRATRYKLTAEWEGKAIRMRKFYGRRTSVIDKLNNLWSKRLEDPIVKMTQHMYDFHVSVSTEGIEYLRNKYCNPVIGAIAEALRDHTYSDNKEDMLDAMESVRIAPEDIILFQFFLKTAECLPVKKGKRLYHSITNLKREHRKFILIDGNPIIEVDIHNSQPTFSAALFINMIKKQLPGETIPTDVNHYANLCLTGQLYEAVAAEAHIELSHDNRKQFKKDFFKHVFYSRVRDQSHSPIKASFERLFPNVYTIIRDIKKKDYKRFPVILQDLEAGIMVYEVYKTLIDEGHKVLVLHDSILCGSNGSQVRAKQLIRESFKKSFDQDIQFKDDLQQDLAA